MSWLSLRDHLAALVDHKIAAEPDREARVLLARHRADIVDQLELQMLRRIIAGRDAGKPTEPKPIKLNGSRSIRVAPR